MAPKLRAGPAHLDPVPDLADRWLFFVVFLLGAGAIISTKLIGLHQLLVTLPPVLVMAGYAWLVLATKRFRLPDDRAGDNLYYLGFLYTLVSLALALYLFANHDRDDTLITNFGVALATTIVGMALRLLAVQMRRDPVEIEREARASLSEAAARFTGDLTNARLDLNRFRQATQQALTDTFDELREGLMKQQAEQARQVAETLRRLDAMHRHHRGELERSVAEAREEIRASAQVIAETAKEFGDKTRTLPNRIDHLNAVITRSVADLSLAMNALVVAVDAMRPPPDLLERHLQPIDERVGALAGTLAAVNDAQAGIAEQVGLQSAHMMNIAKVVESVQKLEQPAARLADRIVELDLAISRLKDYSHEHMVRMGGFVHNAFEAAGAAGQVRQHLDAELKRARELTDEVAARLAENAAAAAAAGDRFKQGLDAELRRSRALTETVADELGRIIGAAEQRIDDARSWQN